MKSWINYYIVIPISFAIRKRISLYEVYSQVWELNNIHLGRYRYRYDPKRYKKKG